jgi:diguanylate cyclase (GGDEF)-like protein
MSEPNENPPMRDARETVEKRKMPDTGPRTLRVETAEPDSQAGSGSRALVNVIRSRADLGQFAFIEGPTTIGRDQECTITLHDFRASRRHVQIVPQTEEIYLLIDLRSTNGTRVNGQLVRDQHILRNGDKIQIGDTVLRFAMADEVELDFHSQVSSMANSDALTGLPAKRRFDQALEFSMEYAKQTGNPLSLLMMDMDGVKQINDRHGHLFGAHVIGETGRLIARTLGNRGQACRFGGDEFSAFIPECDMISACEVAEQIRKMVVSAGFTYEGIPLSPTISIGVAVFPETGADLLSLTARADEALYRAKARGKNCVAT